MPIWDSNGDISKETLEVVYPGGDMHVSGKIDNQSFVLLVCTAGSIIVDDKIDGTSFVVLVSTTGSITIGGKIDGHSNVTLKAAVDVTIGTQGGEGNEKIDGSSQVNVVAGGDITIGSYIHNATVDFTAHGVKGITFTEIDYGATVRQIADSDISVTGKIDGGSRVELVSNRGSVSIFGKIDGGSKVYLTAGQAVAIGADPQLSSGDRKIDGNSFVTAIASGSISLGGGIFKDHTWVDFAAAGDIMIGDSISGGATVRLFSSLGQATVVNGISDNGTQVTFYAPGGLVANVDGNAKVGPNEWVIPDTLTMAGYRTGYWWQNWPQTFGYVAPYRIVPRSVDDIATAITGVGGRVPVKAIGGGWSFTDAALPFQKQSEVDNASIRLRGAWQLQDMRTILEVNDLYPRPMDLLPQAVGRNVAFSTVYKQHELRQSSNSGAQMPPSKDAVRLIDTRGLASSLQCELRDIQKVVPVGGPPPLLFHVEAGITMADLQQLLDHQRPRLALQTSGGSSGATLAGALSTATHGGEFRWPLLADSVRAVHLVGPGGEQWWIEGDLPVADQKKLQLRFPKIDKAHFIAKGFKGIKGLSAQDVLNAVAVSMGTMGVIYSVVLSVVRQFGLRQIVQPTSWLGILDAAGVTEDDLRAGDSAANQAVLNVLLDGSLNGTGIAEADNVYADLAINPLNRDCWVVNRQVTLNLPDDANSPPTALGDYMTALSRAFASTAVDTVMDSKTGGRLFDFLSWPTSVPSANLDDDINVANQAGRLLSFLTRSGDVLSGTLAALNLQAGVNVVNQQKWPDRGYPFLADVVIAFFHALEGTAPGVPSDRTGVSYKVGAIGWPDGGIPGRAIEIALDMTNAFTFVQTVLLDGVLNNATPLFENPLIGYISIRVCPPTQTLMGMQQYSKYSVMVEVVGYRSPEANAAMDAIQTGALTFSTAGPMPLLHWGLENDQLTQAYLTTTPLGQPFKGKMTRLDAFTKVREFFKKAHFPVFDNNFTSRLGL